MLLVLSETIHRHPRARLVRILEGHLRALQQLIGSAAMSGEQAYAARQAHIEGYARQMKARAGHRDQLLGIQQRALGGAARRDHQQLRFTETCDRVGDGHVVLQPAGRFAQHLVSDLVS